MERLEAAVRRIPLPLLRGFALAGALAAALAAAAAQRSEMSAALRAGRPVVGILFGTDLVDHARHSDTLMWWRYDPAHGRLDVLSIPRDTRVDVPGYKFHRVNEVFPYHFSRARDRDAAAEALRKAVAGLLGVAGTPLEPRVTVHVEYGGFRRFIDQIGGVRVRVDEPMHYDDNAGGLHIHYDEGEHHLDGAKALEYVRFRGKSGDLGRIWRQMDFLRLVLKKLSSPAVFFRWPGLLVTAAGGIRTSLSPADLLFLGVEAKHLRPDRVTPARLPGKPRGASWDVDRDRLAYMMAQWGGRPPAAAPPPAGLSGRITVKVRNGTRRPRLALEAARRLRAAGFDVVDWGDASRQTKTRVMDRAGAIENARKVAQTLGAESVMSDVDPSLRTDVEVFLGDDYK